MADDDTKDPKKGGSDENGKDTESPQGNLDKLLADWDRQKKEPAKSDESKKPADDKEVKDTKSSGDGWGPIDDFEYDRLIERLKGDLDVEDFEVDGWLKHQAITKPQIIDYFNNRHESEVAKGQFRELAKTLVPEFQAYAKERFGPKKEAEGDGKEGDDKDAGKDDRDDKGMKAAIRSSREAKSGDDFEDVDVSGLSPSEFARHRSSVFAHFKNQGKDSRK